MWSWMPLILLLLRWRQEDQTWKTSLRCVTNGGDDNTSWQFSFCMLIVSVENGCSDFPFLYVMSCPVAPLQVFPYPWFMTLYLYKFLSVIHGWVCWVSWSCQFVILIWNSFTIIGPGHCSVCPPLEDSSFIHVVCELMHVLTCCLELPTAHACALLSLSSSLSFCVVLSSYL